MTSNQIRADFDRIAEMQIGDERDNNRRYHKYLLSQLPVRCSWVMEIGCGTGEFARQLAARAEYVSAIDLSPKMIARARANVAASANIDYLVQDVTEWEWPVTRFDAIVSIATLHHLSLAPTLRKCSLALRQGGVLAVLDLYRPQTLADFVTFAVAYPLNGVMRMRPSEGPRPSRQLQSAFAAHGQYDRYLTLSEVRRATAEVGLHHSRVRRHLFWRYSLVCKKPTS